MRSSKQLQRPVIYVYRGTFDPFHNNHEAISRWCLSQPNTENLVIHINYRLPAASTEKQPASWEARFGIIQRVLKDKAEIRPKEDFDTTLDWIVSRYGSDVEIIQVLGSDVLEQVKDKPQITAYAQHIRIEETISAKHLHNKPLFTIPLNLPPVSSTKIRRSLVMGKLNDAATMLSKNAIEYIKITNDYSQLYLSIRHLKKNQLLISNDSIKKLEINFGSDCYLEDKTQQLKGLSGDAIFSVANKNRLIAIGKLFHLGDVACKQEVHNHRLMARFVKTPLIYFTNDNLVCMKHIDGKPPQSVDDYERIGKAYRALHQKSLSHCETYCNASELHQLNSKLAILCKKITEPLLSKEIAQVFNKLLKRYIESPHKGAVIHGDAQPGNVLIKENEIVFIDFGKVKQNEDPARDVNQMMASIYWKAWQNGATGPEDVLVLKKHIKAFKNGYSYKINTPADQFWSFYWHVRNLILTLKHPELALSKHIQEEFNTTLAHAQIFEPICNPYAFFKEKSKPLSIEEITLCLITDRIK